MFPFQNLGVANLIKVDEVMKVSPTWMILRPL
jgi:hypothetical protein